MSYNNKHIFFFNFNNFLFTYMYAFNDELRKIIVA